MQINRIERIDFHIEPIDLRYLRYPGLLCFILWEDIVADAGRVFSQTPARYCVCVSLFYKQRYVWPRAPSIGKSFVLRALELDFGPKMWNKCENNVKIMWNKYENMDHEVSIIPRILEISARVFLVKITKMHKNHISKISRISGTWKKQISNISRIGEYRKS